MFNTNIPFHAAMIGASLGSILALGMLVMVEGAAPVVSREVVVHQAAPEEEKFQIPHLRQGFGGQANLKSQTTVETIRNEETPLTQPTQQTQETQETLPKTPIVREALRLEHRLTKEGKLVPPLPALVQAVETRQHLLSGSLTVQFQPPDDTQLEPWVISLQQYPHWLALKTGPTTARFVVDVSRIRSSIAREGYPKELSPPVHSAILDVTEDRYGVIRAKTNRLSRPGFVFNIGEVAPLIARALETETEALQIPVTADSGRIFFASASGIVTLDLLATGKSNFAGSVANRSFNIKKALNERLNNILVPPGQTFSFNSSLGTPVAGSTGWLDALGIFDGWDLRPTPGGGICQTSTTLYRAILNAGLPIEEQHNHSLYVHYYEKYGVGLDATIYLGDKDLIFTNDTPSWLLVQAYPEGHDAYIHIYGVRDGREVALNGPYLSTNAPDGFEVNGRSLRSNEIAWTYRLKHPDGTVKEQTLVSRYKDIPARLFRTYQVAKEEE